MVGTLTVAGCGASDTPTGSPRASPSAPTTTASPTATTTATTATTATVAPKVTPVTRPGDAAIGKTIFKKTCGDCHEGLGTRAFFGPKLSEQGLSEALIRKTVRDGRNQMPAGRVEGQDYEDIVAYVLSLQ